MRKIISAFLAIAGLAFGSRVYQETPGGTPDGTLATFTLAQPASPSSLEVTVNGLGNYQGVDYDFTAGAIVFRAASIPQAGWTLRASYDVVPPPVMITIDAGGPGDQYFTPPSTCAGNGSCAYSDPKMGAAPYNTLRYGFGMIPFSYAIPAPNGTCNLTLGFSEPNKTAVGQRIFTITANDQTVANVDVFARAGAAKTVVTIPLSGVVVSDGFLHLTFTPQPNTWNAFVSAITAVCQPNF